MNEGAIRTTISSPMFLESSLELATVLKTYSVKGIQELMGVSENLAQLNYERYQDFSQQGHTSSKAMPAIFAFHGDVYRNMKAEDWDKEVLHKAQISLGILSGMYGLLRPLDAILPYRLEMGTALKTSRGSNLYEFWQESITEAINQHMRENQLSYLVNLASEEYAKSVKLRKIEQRVLTVVFKDWVKGRLKTVGVNAKRARGSMANLMMCGDIQKIDDIKQLNPLGYQYQEDNSNDAVWVFIRERVS